MWCPVAEFVGRRHHDTCGCGCQHVVGLPGIEAPECRDYHRVGLVGVAFDVPSRTGGGPHRIVIAYGDDEIQSGGVAQRTPAALPLFPVDHGSSGGVGS